ncbi:hypothetical protein [Streptacidiphilus rugosus]|uniref:hypothetical protein n=1 Tax=Streptacidiphilus rugosus TaxID=405783 RepID=UPI00068C31E3|nr:hypothetical protein [Streptacidiphilus rugosus]
MLRYAAGLAVLGGGGTTAWRAWADAGDDRREQRLAGVVRTLDRRSAAVRARDAAALAATVVPDPGAAGLRRRQYQLVANLARVPLAQWTWRVVSVDAYPLPAAIGGGERVAVRAELGYRFTGFDAQPVTATQYLTFERQADGEWLLASDGDHPGGDVQLWDLGPVGVVLGRYSIVLGLREQAVLAAIGAQADQAVPAVSAVWGSGWGQRTVLLAPRSTAQFGALLGADPAGFTGLAAVTTGELGAADRGRTERITINPAAWDGLNALGRQVVTTHETTHVATRTQTERWTPRWLSEGVADWTGFLGTGRTPREITPELAAAVARAGAAGPDLLAALPADAAFAGTGAGTSLQQAYQEAWFACRTVVQRYGQQKLVALYAAVAADGGGQGAQQSQDAVLDRALRGTLGLGTAAFTALWRADLLAALRP